MAVNPGEIAVPLPVDDIETLRRRRSAKWRTYDDDVLPLPVAETDFGLAPVVRDALAEAVARSDTGYAMTAPALGEAVAGFAERHWGWRIDPDAVAGLTDVGVAAVEVLRAVCDPGDAVVVSPPVYPPFFGWVEEVGCRLVEAPLRQDRDGTWALDLDALESAFRQRPRAYVLCSPHNPVGRVHDPDQLAAVARLAAEHDVTVIADEIHAPLVLPGASFTPFLTVPGGADVGISLLSASKAFNLAGLKCAAVVTSSDRMRAVTHRLPPDGRWRVGHFGVLATVAALTDGDEWLAALVATLERRREQLGALVRERLPAVCWSPPEATFLAWLDCRAIGSGAGPRDLFLAKGRVALEPGRSFGTPGDGWVRLNFGTSAVILSEAVARMGTAWP